MRFDYLGDQAVVAYCDDERQAIHWTAEVSRLQPGWLIDVVQAYVSVAVYYDLTQIDFTEAVAWLAQNVPEASPHPGPNQARSHRIPCCYGLGVDWDRIEMHTGLDRVALIALHSQTVYTVYAIGFCPGFPYLGYLPAALAGVPRLPSPRLRVDAGSVGLTGRQTGIYTEARPGGWNIVGKTPLQLVDVRDGYFPLRTGDNVQFQPIDEQEFAHLRGQRLQ